MRQSREVTATEDSGFGSCSLLSGIGDFPPRLLNFTNLDIFVIGEDMAKREYLGNFELMVMLALIRLGESAYGVPISHEIEEKSGREVALGSVYAALERLEGKGFVSSSLGEPTPERGGRAKTYFRVTPRGFQQARETQRALKNLWQGLPQLEGGRA
jgi:PadR family transcriptional regulator PadR